MMGHFVAVRQDVHEIVTGFSWPATFAKARAVLKAARGARAKQTHAASSNGRTADFESVNAGSNPDAAAKTKGSE